MEKTATSISRVRKSSSISTFIRLKFSRPVRISYLLNNRCFVISEESEINPYPKIDLRIVPYDDLSEACCRALADEAEIRRMGNVNFEEFKKNYPMTDLIHELIG